MPQTMLRRILHNAFAMMFSQATVKGLGLVWLIVVARHLGDADFGLLNLALSLAGLFGLVAGAGLAPVMTRAVARDRSLAQTYLSNVLTLRLILGLLAVPLMVLAATATGADRTRLAPVLIVGLTILTSSLSAIPGALFVAHERMKYPAAVMTAGKIVSVVVGLLLVWKGFDLTGIACVFLLEGVLSTVISFPLMAGKLGLGLRLGLDAAFCRRLLRDAWPFALTLALGVISFKIDTVMLSAMKESHHVGWYSAAFRLLEGVVYLPAAFVAVMFPTFSRLKVESPDALRSTFENAWGFVIALSLPIALGLALLSDRVVLTLYGTGYLEAVPALQWIGAALFFVFLSGFLGSILGAIDRQKIHLSCVLIAVTLNVTLNLVLIPRYAHVGAARATLITEAALTVLLSVFVLRLVRPSVPIARLAKVAFSGALMATVLWKVPEWNLWTAGLAGFGAYAAALLLTGAITPGEREQIRAALAGRKEGRR